MTEQWITITTDADGLVTTVTVHSDRPEPLFREHATIWHAPADRDGDGEVSAVKVFDVHSGSEFADADPHWHRDDHDARVFPDGEGFAELRRTEALLVLAGHPRARTTPTHAGGPTHGWGLICDGDHMFAPTGEGWQHYVRDGYADDGWTELDPVADPDATPAQVAAAIATALTDN